MIALRLSGETVSGMALSFVSGTLTLASLIKEEQ